MPAFTYTARALNGDLRTATIEAPNRDEVVAQLRAPAAQRRQDRRGQPPRRRRSGGKIKMRDIVIFTRQFSTMINAGLPLVQALDILAKQSENPALKDVTNAVVFDVESGHTVADALRKHPKAFSELYVNMVAAGEAGGILDTILMRLATFMEKNDALVRKVKGAMIYPGVIIERRGDRHQRAAHLRHPGVREDVRVSVGLRAAAADARRHRDVEVPQRLLVGGARRRLSSASFLLKQLLRHVERQARRSTS